MADEGAGGIWYKLVSLLFTRWWAGLLLGPAILAGGAYWLWSVVEAPWAQLHPIEIYEVVLQGLCGLSLALVGLAALLTGLSDLLFGSSDGADPPSAPPASADRPRE